MTITWRTRHRCQNGPDQSAAADGSSGDDDGKPLALLQRRIWELLGQQSDESMTMTQLEMELCHPVQVQVQRLLKS
jgi:hypothetical protein